MKVETRAKLNLTPEQLKAQQKQEATAKQEKAKASGILRDDRGRILPGYSGNNLGRPRTALAELCRKEVTKHGLVNVLGNIAARSGVYAKKTTIPLTTADQLQAIRLLLLYGFGVPKAEIDSTDGLKIQVVYADNRAVNITNAAPGPGPNHPAGQAVQCRVLREAVREDDTGSGPIDSSGTEG
jgi:hypothetical protein